MGTSCSLKWREANDKERLWVVQPGHPIADGVGRVHRNRRRGDVRRALRHPRSRTTLVFVSWFTGGEVFRSGCCYFRGRGKIFYFRPGHETYPTYYNQDVLRVIANGVRWAAPVGGPNPVFGNSKPLEKPVTGSGIVVVLVVECLSKSTTRTTTRTISYPLTTGGPTQPLARPRTAGVPRGARRAGGRGPWGSLWARRL